MNQEQIAKQAMMAQLQATALVAETYTGAWGTWRKIMAEEDNNDIIISVINLLLVMMEKQSINVLEAAHIKSTELETPAGKMLVMAATVEILLGKFQPGQVVTVEQLQPWPNA